LPWQAESPSAVRLNNIAMILTGEHLPAPAETPRSDLCRFDAPLEDIAEYLV
jgi:hypothetical protein